MPHRYKTLDVDLALAIASFPKSKTPTKMDSFQEHFKAFSFVAQEINSSLQISSLSSSKLKQSLQNISQFFAVSNDQVIVRPLFACLPQEISSSFFGSKDNGKRYLLVLDDGLFTARHDLCL